ncbi:MAG: DUF488 family protein, N3 subclade [Pseudobdellovibrionaceae bacterium]
MESNSYCLFIASSLVTTPLGMIKGWATLSVGDPLIKRASVSEVKNKKISKTLGYLVVTMRIYPRFLSKELVNEYKPSLSPQKDLFQRYRDFKKKNSDQNKSFEMANYQQEFDLSEDARRDLAELVKRSKHQDVYMICQCERDERCHVDLMLLIAEKEYGAEIENLPFDYLAFRRRLSI